MSLPGKYFFYHSGKIANKFIISKTMLESGLIIDMFYTSKLKPEEMTKIQASRRYIVIVLHPGWGTPNKFMHAITLDNIPAPSFDKFIKRIGLVESERFKRVKKLNIPKLDMEKEEAKTFYLTELKNPLQNDPGLSDCYRTFAYENILRVNVVDYKFNKELLKTLKL